MRRGGGRCSETIKGSKIPGSSAQAREHLPCGRGADPGQQLHDAERGYRVPGVLDPAQNAKHVLDMGRFEDFSPPYLTNGTPRRASSISS